MTYLPNCLTIIRIITIPFIIYLFSGGNYLEAGLLFTFSASTDFFDGYLARKYNLVSKLGKLLDPLADKLTIISILIILIMSNIIPKYIAVILLAREVFILISSGIAYLLGIDVINPTRLGKISIFILYLAIAVKLLNIPYINMILFYIVIPLNIISAVDYYIKALKKYRNK